MARRNAMLIWDGYANGKNGGWYDRLGNDTSNRPVKYPSMGIKDSLVESIVSMKTMELEHMLILAMVCILSSQIFYPTTLERLTTPMS